MPKSSAERAQEYRQNQRALGRVRHDYWATPEEHEFIKERLKTLRDNKKQTEVEE